MSFAIYAIAVVGETNRAPFDLPEAESELVGGFHTEYSSFKFAMFFLAEYINMVTVSALATTLFLGGWRAPWPMLDLGRRELAAGGRCSGSSPRWSSASSCSCWLRGTLPRLRYDQFMAFGWKVLIPINLVWILAVTSIRVLRTAAGRPGRPPRSRSDGAAARRRPALMICEGTARRRPPSGAEEDEDEAGETPTFPVPPMDLVVPSSPPRRARVSAAGRATEAAELAQAADRRSRRGRARRGEPTAALGGFAKGFGLTFATMFKKVYTQQYPFDVFPTAPRYHGRHVLNRHPDGLEKCVGCELCAWACPADAIYVEGGDNTAAERYLAR